jgi:hypothetical protein
MVALPLRPHLHSTKIQLTDEPLHTHIRPVAIAVLPHEKSHSRDRLCGTDIHLTFAEATRSEAQYSRKLNGGALTEVHIGLQHENLCGRNQDPERIVTEHNRIEGRKSTRVDIIIGSLKVEDVKNSSSHPLVGRDAIVVEGASQLGIIVAGSGPYCSGLHPGRDDRSASKL